MIYDSDLKNFFLVTNNEVVHTGEKGHFFFKPLETFRVHAQIHIQALFTNGLCVPGTVMAAPLHIVTFNAQNNGKIRGYKLTLLKSER